MAELAAADDALQRPEAVCIRVVCQRSMGTRDRRVIPGGGHQGVGKPVVLRRRGVGAAVAVVDEVAVQVDVVLGHAAQPGETVRIDRVNEDHGGATVVPQHRGMIEQSDLNTGAAEALGTVGAGHDEHDAFGAGRAEVGDVGIQGLATWSARRIAA